MRDEFEFDGKIPGEDVEESNLAELDEETEEETEEVKDDEEEEEV